LCNPGLKTRHWDDIKKLIDMKDFKDNEKLSTLISLGISQYKDKLEDISETASKEYSNERTLAKMHEDWSPLEFTCKDWKNGSFILDGEAVEVIQQLLDDHIIKTQTMKGSPYAKVFLPKIIEWESNLLRIQENLEVWLQVQAVWLYLEPVFSSEDIMKQMPVEGTKFREVDRAWRSLMNRINENPKALDVI
jgi:dynein heavy chain